MEIIKVLNRAFFILLLGIHSLQINGQIDTQVLKKEWISVDYRYTDKSDGWYIKEANILSFTDNQIEGYYAWDDSLSIFTIELNDSLIISNDTLDYGKILFLSTDSMLISLDQGKMITTYIPIEHKGCEISKQLLDTILTKNAWSKIYPYGEMKIDFWDIDASTPMIKYCNVIVENKYDFYMDGGYWSTFNYKGNSFLYISIDPTSLYKSGLFHVIEIESSEIKTQTLSINESKSVSFNAIENLSSTRYDRLVSILTSRQWHVDSIQNMIDFFKLDESDLDELIIPISRFRKEDWLLKDDFQNKAYTYTFDTGGGYTISKDNLVLDKGTWNLSRNGQYLYLRSEQTGMNVLKLLHYDSNQIQMRHKIHLKVSTETNEVKRYDYIIWLN